jgi:hypothetical protein
MVDQSFRNGARAVRPLLIFKVVVFILPLCLADEPSSDAFDPERDLISLHYDHAPDKDDGHSAAADRTILQSLYSVEWMKKHTLAVSGAYGKNANSFRPKSDNVMDVVWNDCGGWIAAHKKHARAVDEIGRRWSKVLAAGGDIWVKEGGQSDITAAVVKVLKRQIPSLDTKARIHVVQHSKWNENQTTVSALEYTRQNTDYINIRDANAYLNIKGGDRDFIAAARNHPQFGASWGAAFNYYEPTNRLDFSDTGELMHILGLGEMGIEQFQKRFLSD